MTKRIKNRPMPRGRDAMAETERRIAARRAEGRARIASDVFGVIAGFGDKALRDTLRVCSRDVHRGVVQMTRRRAFKDAKALLHFLLADTELGRGLDEKIAVEWLLGHFSEMSVTHIRHRLAGVVNHVCVCSDRDINALGALPKVCGAIDSMAFDYCPEDKQGRQKLCGVFAKSKRLRALQVDGLKEEVGVLLEASVRIERIESLRVSTGTIDSEGGKALIALLGKHMGTMRHLELSCIFEGYEQNAFEAELGAVLEGSGQLEFFECACAPVASYAGIVEKNAGLRSLVVPAWQFYALRKSELWQKVEAHEALEHLRLRSYFNKDNHAEPTFAQPLAKMLYENRAPAELTFECRGHLKQEEDCTLLLALEGGLEHNTSVKVLNIHGRLAGRELAKQGVLQRFFRDNTGLRKVCITHEYDVGRLVPQVLKNLEGNETLKVLEVYCTGERTQCENMRARQEAIIQEAKAKYPGVHLRLFY